MTGWSISVMLLLGIAAGPYGLHVLSPAVLSLLDPGIAMGLAMLGVFVGLSFDPRHRPTARSVTASLVRTGIVMIRWPRASYRRSCIWTQCGPLVGPAGCSWRLRSRVGSRDRRQRRRCVDDRCGGARDGRARDPDPALGGFIAGALFVVALLVAAAGWLLVGQTHRSRTARLRRRIAAGRVEPPPIWECPRCSPALSSAPPGTSLGASPRPRIMRDLYYFQHPLVVLVLVVAGAHATLSVEAFALAAVFIAVRAIARKRGAWAREALNSRRYCPREFADCRRSHRDRHRDRHLPGRSGHRAGRHDRRHGRHRHDRVEYAVRVSAVARLRSVHRAVHGYGAFRRSMKRLAGIVLIAAAMVIVREVGPAGDVGETRPRRLRSDSRSSPRS